MSAHAFCPACEDPKKSCAVHIEPFPLDVAAPARVAEPGLPQRTPSSIVGVRRTEPPLVAVPKYQLEQIESLLAQHGKHIAMIEQGMAAMNSGAGAFASLRDEVQSLTQAQADLREEVRASVERIEAAGRGIVRRLDDLLSMHSRID